MGEVLALRPIILCTMRLSLFLCYSLYAKHSGNICEELKAGLDNRKLTLFLLVVGSANPLSPSQPKKLCDLGQK